MVNVYFCLGALVLFTIGFRLVKLGNPYKRGGGDSYTQRRMYRMLGWMMWTTAGVMVVLTLINQLLSDRLTDATMAQSTGRPEISQIRTVTSTPHYAPNLLTDPALQANAPAAAAAAKAATTDTGSLTLSGIEQHPMSLSPTLLGPAPDAAPVAPKVEDSLPDTQAFTTAAATAPAAASASPVPAAPVAVPAPQAVSPPPAPPANGNGAIDPAKLKELNAELAAADAIVKKDPSNVIGYLQRGNAYGNERQWDLAKSDYEHALQIDHTCVTASFNIAELDFMQGHYQAARPGFLAIVNSSDFGDLAKYKVFLCDLFSGREQVAAKELAVFNQVGSEASYYFANVAWSAYHKKKDDAQSWLDSANQIFAPEKVNLYAKPLIDLGYINLAS